MAEDLLNHVPVARQIRLAGMQKMIAERLVESLRTTASVTAMAEAPVAALLARQARWRRAGHELNLTHLLIHALARCLARHPALNAVIHDGSIHEYAEINIALAVSLADGGLQSVVVRRADEKAVPDVAAEVQALTGRARDGKLALADVRGGTFSLSNYGALKHVVWATPIIAPGQSAVLGAGRIHPSLVTADGASGHQIVDTLPLSLTYDHRLINGMFAGAFLEDLIMLLDTGGADGEPD